MNRWWADPEGARWALGLVDEDNVRMGVGTAVLGYHGVALEHLKPLASQTLVDARVLLDQLDKVDLAPVAEAVSKAVTPVMGEASMAYGRLWAQDLHDRALETSMQLFTSLTQNGMSYPQAVDRVIAVHGLPAEQMGSVAKHLREPKVSARVMDDYADRALMEYAMHRGALEDTGVVSKADAFEERAHPRDAKGRFKDKHPSASGGKDPDVAAREERMERRRRGLRRVKHLSDQRKQIEQMQARVAASKPKAGAQMKQLVLSGKKQAPPRNALAPGTMFGDAVRRQQLGLQGARNAAIDEGIVSIEEVPYDYTPDEQEIVEQLSMPRSARSQEHSMLGEDRFVILTNGEWDLLRSADVDEFSVGGFKALTGNPMLAYSASDARAEVQSLINDHAARAEDFVMVRLSGRIPLHEGVSLNPDESDSVLIPDSAMYAISDLFAWNGGFDLDDQMVVEQYTNNPVWGQKGDVLLKVVDLQLTNEKQFPLTRQDRARPLRRYEPTDIDDDGWGVTMGKADAFDEREHPRDSQGKFRDKDVQPGSGDRALQERMDRRRRARGRNSRSNQLLDQLERIKEQRAARPEPAQMRQITLSGLKQQAAPKNALADPAYRARILQASQRAAAPSQQDDYETMAALTFDASDLMAFAEITGFGPGRGDLWDAGDMSSLASMSIDHDVTDLVAEKRATSSAKSIERMLRMTMTSQNRMETVRNPVTDNVWFSSPADAAEQADRAAAKAEGKDGFGNMVLPYIEERPTDGNSVMYTAHTLRLPNEPIGYQIVGDPEAIKQLQLGNKHLVQFEDQGHVGARELADRSGMGLDPSEVPDAPIRVAVVRLRDNASDREEL